MKYIFLVILAMVALTACQSEVPMPEGTQTEVSDVPQVQIESDGSEMAEEQVTEPDHVFVVTGQDFAFFIDGEDNPDMIVQQGDLVRVEFTTTDNMMHDWVVDELNVATEIVALNETSVVEFVADTTGQFSYYCSVGSHRERGMVGSFIVEE